MLKNHVRYYRQRRGLTLKQLSQLTGVGLSTICEIEKGAEPRVITALLIAKALRVPVEQLWKI